MKQSEYFAQAEINWLMLRTPFVSIILTIVLTFHLDHTVEKGEGEIQDYVINANSLHFIKRKFNFCALCNARSTALICRCRKLVTREIRNSQVAFLLLLSASSHHFCLPQSYNSLFFVCYWATRFALSGRSFISSWLIFVLGLPSILSTLWCLLASWRFAVWLLFFFFFCNSSLRYLNFHFFIFFFGILFGILKLMTF